MKFEQYKIEVGTCILKARREQGVTQQELAEAIGCSQSAITQMESGKTLPAMATLFQIGRVLSIPVTQLVPDTVPNRILGHSLLALCWSYVYHCWKQWTGNGQ